MPSHKALRTYEKKVGGAKSVDAFNALLAKNLTQRLKSRRKRKPKITVKELPPKTRTNLTDDSLKVELNDTFDKLVQGNIYGKVNVCNFVKYNSSDDQNSVNVSFNRPKITRGRKKPSVIITDVVENNKSSTLDKPVTSSLCIEKENKTVTFSSLSYIKLPKIGESEVMKNVEPIFSKTFRERHTVHSSTPYVPTTTKKIIEDSISPITKSESSNSSNLIEKSYDQIRKWDENFPNLEVSTPKSKQRPPRRRKMSITGDSYHTSLDWKLKLEPKVYLKNFIGAKKIKTPSKKGDDSDDEAGFAGFTKGEQSSSNEMSNSIDALLNDVSQSYIKTKQSLQKLNNKKKVSSKKSTGALQKKDKIVVNKKVSVTPRKSKRSRNYQFQQGRKPQTPIKKLSERKNSGSSSILCLKKRRLIGNSVISRVRKRKCVDVTEDILSEKEISTSFSFESEEEVPKSPENRITVSLEKFNNFMESLQIENSITQETDYSASIISVSDDSLLKTHDIVDEKPENKDLNFVVTPNNKRSSFNNSGDKKIIILSNIQISPGKIKTEAMSSHVYHDHSYSSPIPKTHSAIDQNSSLSAIFEASAIENLDVDAKERLNNRRSKPARNFKDRAINLKPGKNYRRSLSLLRRSSFMVDVRKADCEEDCVCLRCLLGRDRRRSIHIVPIKNKAPRKSLLQIYAASSARYARPDEDYNDNFQESIRNLSLNARKPLIPEEKEAESQVTAKELVLRRCGQTEIQKFDDCYPPSVLHHCQKIGEGVYGEVFLYKNPNGGTSVIKIIPIEGDQMVNGEKQKTFEEVISEIVISMELSNLRNNEVNKTSNYSEVQKIRCTYGNYPDKLIDLWELYEEVKGTENDSPQMFASDQIYMVLELANGGQDLESFIFNNAVQAYSMLQQVACAIAVAESQLKFEHRDLHWGNILIQHIEKDKNLQFRLNGKELEVETCGVEATIIDFTLSRIEFEGVVIFNDLSQDNDLFAAKGDYQFEIYRLMQQSNGNEWQHFEPHTNILWLHYLLDKVPELRYKNSRSKIHKEYLGRLKKIKDEVLSYNSVTEFVKDKFFF